MRVVELISQDDKYRKERYPFVAAVDPVTGDIRNGLEYQAGVEGKEDYLTQEEIRGKEISTKARADKFPPESVIRADDVIYLPHGQKMRLSTKGPKHDGKFPGDYIYPREHALYMFLLMQPRVAKSKEDFNASHHIFYLLDREHEAAVKMDTRKSTFKAQEFLFNNASLEFKRRIAMLISFKTKGYKFGDVEKLTATTIDDKLFEIAEKEPKLILKCDPKGNPNVEVELFIIDAINKGVIKQVGVDYYDGDKYAGADLPQLVKYLNDNDKVALRWKTMMKG